MDNEGPAQSVEITGACSAWGDDTPSELPDDLTWDEWATWTMASGGDTFELFYRPPLIVADSPPTAAEAEPFLTWLASTHGAAYGPWFPLLLVEDGVPFTEEMSEFWEHREPAVSLAGMGTKCAYVRIQTRTSGAPSPSMSPADETPAPADLFVSSPWRTAAASSTVDAPETGPRNRNAAPSSS